MFSGTIASVSSNVATLSGNATGTSGTDSATYIVFRNERYYSLALQGVCDANNESFYLHVDNAGAETAGGAYRYGLMFLPAIGDNLVVLDNMVSSCPNIGVTNGKVLTGCSRFDAISVSRNY